jgi:hypothetical protein
MAALFGVPECETDRPSRLDANRFQDPQRFDHHDAAGGVVGRTGAGMPRIEMTAEHDHFACQPRGRCR